MKLYVTLHSPYARLAHILVVEKALEDHIAGYRGENANPR